MKELASRFTSLLNGFKETQEEQSLHVKINRLLQEIRLFIDTKPVVKLRELSEDSLSTFLKNYAAADEIGQKERSVNPPDLIFWNALGFGTDEVTNCRILSWLLDPSADHCQGNRFFACLLKLDSLKEYSHYATKRIYVNREEWLDETNRADITINGVGFNIVIETKIKAPERTNQRIDYHESMKRKYPSEKNEFIGIYLTLNNKHEKVYGWISITWKDICTALNLFTSLGYEYSCNNFFVRELSNQYCKYIVNNIIC